MNATKDHFRETLFYPRIKIKEEEMAIAEY